MRILLGVLYLSVWYSPCYLHRQYYYAPGKMNWTEAQRYCNETYTDLASPVNYEEVQRAMKTVSTNKDVWIGQYNEIKWMWSDNITRSGDNYTAWAPNQPVIYHYSDACVITTGQMWEVHLCTHTHPFVCYNGSREEPNFVLVKQIVNWNDARKHCREKYTDLAIVRNETQNQLVQSLVQAGDWTWIGLFGNLSWSSARTNSLSFLYTGSTQIGETNLRCVAFSQTNPQWRLRDCDDKLPALCYKDLPPGSLQVVKLRMKVSDSSVDLNDPTVKENLLKKFYDRLAEKGVTGVKLKWKEKPDGKVFHKQSDGAVNRDVKCD